MLIKGAFNLSHTGYVMGKADNILHGLKFCPHNKVYHLIDILSVLIHKQGILGILGQVLFCLLEHISKGHDGIPKLLKHSPDCALFAVNYHHGDISPGHNGKLYGKRLSVNIKVQLFLCLLKDIAKKGLRLGAADKQVFKAYPLGLHLLLGYKTSYGICINSFNCHIVPSKIRSQDLFQKFRVFRKNIKGCKIVLRGLRPPYYFKALIFL